MVAPEHGWRAGKHERCLLLSTATAAKRCITLATGPASPRSGEAARAALTHTPSSPALSVTPPMRVCSCAAGPSLATCGPGPRDSWQWSAQALRCGASRQDAEALRALLAHRWFVVAGDSIGRFFFAALLRLLSNSRARLLSCLCRACICQPDAET